MEKGLQNYGKDSYKGVTETWNIVQHELKCCGAQEYLDWENTTFSQESNSVPDSCCLSDVEGCGAGILAMSQEQVSKNGLIPFEFPATELKLEMAQQVCPKADAHATH